MAVRRARAAKLIDNPVGHAPGFPIGNVHVMAGAEKRGVLQARCADLDIGSYRYVRQGKVGAAIVLRGVDEPRVDAAAVIALDIEAAIEGSGRGRDTR